VDLIFALSRVEETATTGFAGIERMVDANAAITTPRSSTATTASGDGFVLATRAADHSGLLKSIANDLDIPRSVIGT
jgi:hypothetical protein